ncbi:MAG TPA: PEP/pyruvate-binding domain-containing protein, partial [Candidatus Eremiobacteraceae bacterium]|nr:PEP/pyruvate-binding domain-containing protein [Candidatus Eremiobacteraceae bacterium]
MIGGKARALVRLQEAGFQVPPFFVIGSGEPLKEQAIRAGCDRLAADSKAVTFAVRSSADAEDGTRSSYAGMFETFLFVAAADVGDRARRVRTSVATDRVRAYDSWIDKRRGHTSAVVVQLMVDADVSGVAFGRDPVGGRDRAVVVANFGIGSGVVGGDCDTDTFHVSRDMHIVERRIAHKAAAHRRAPTLAGVDSVVVDAARTDAPALSDGDVLRVVEVLRAIETLFGSAQDMEWAMSGGSLYVLQARAVTTQASVVWDNSNIAESYGGLVSPLTFSFARHAYATAYRQLMRIFGIGRRRIDAHSDALESMLGLVNGRMYYDLLNWYRLLALVPGFGVNRRFMESMMGVPESLPTDVLDEIERRGKARDVVAVAKMFVALLYRFMRLRHDVHRFHRRVESTLASSPGPRTLDPAGLLDEFSRLETALLTNWEAPLVNDFFAMVFYGTLRALSSRWCGDDKGSLHNDLLCSSGGMVSTEPALLISGLAAMVRGDEALLAAIETCDPETAMAAIRTRPLVLDGYMRYLERFGDRCPNELKLESLTLHQDPCPLLRSIARLARQLPTHLPASEPARAIRRSAEVRATRALRSHPLRSITFRFVLGQARSRIRDRENLRMERTRVFARVRGIMLDIGRQLQTRGVLTDARDIFWLELSELSDAVGRPALAADIRQRIEERRAQYAGYAQSPAPPDRFTAFGTTPPRPSEDPPGPADPSTRTGIGCCQGRVRARVRVVKDVQSPLKSGEILVAERTDPGWIVLFPAAAGILVERGSLLSHAAIVSREMGIPSVVGIAGLTRWLRDGDLVELDG